MNIWKHKDIEIAFDAINDNSNIFNKDETFDVSHSIRITKGRNASSEINKNIEHSSQIIFICDAIDTLLSLDYRNRSQLNGKIYNGDFLRNSYAYNYKLEDEYVGTHGINIERIDIEYRHDNSSKLELKTSFNLSITFYDEDTLHIGSSVVIRDLTKDDLIRFSNVVSSFLDTCR